MVPQEYNPERVEYCNGYSTLSGLCGRVFSRAPRIASGVNDDTPSGLDDRGVMTSPNRRHWNPGMGIIIGPRIASGANDDAPSGWGGANQVLGVGRRSAYASYDKTGASQRSTSSTLIFLRWA
ncbi:hypothetical protein [Larkinella knui]|uniref:Uncharacterized protein n=1 Tax=Larkinella knui TaxID=2025310 RepID=A0A3P1CPS4_9BACT|nr:hypothetical protein [Larkinella knui]RRB15249.1 hypothetical protein EHT87_11955 [Larkinella knui]